MANRAFVGLGSNWGDSLRIVKTAAHHVTAMGYCPRYSSVYVTLPQGGPSQPSYFNAVVAIETNWPPEQLLSLLEAIEVRFGRCRRERFGPRILDLDLLLYGDRVMNGVKLTLPHPRLCERRFVLQPLTEVDPHLVLPGGLDIWSALSQVASQEVTLLCRLD